MSLKVIEYPDRMEENINSNNFKANTDENFFHHREQDNSAQFEANLIQSDPI